MVRLLNKEIENKVIEIVAYIKETDYYKNYLIAKELLESNHELMNLIDEIKLLQKEIIKNPSKKKELEINIQEKLSILEEDSLYLEYINNQNEINNILTIFENKLNKYFFDIFN